jgi:2-dehydro-3-deoxyphosphogluconate aldolase / (4S)-4-hydroxy-2-oxoglutarate aldolase
MIDVIRKIAELKVVPVVAIEEASAALALGEALVAGGLPIAEITFRTAAAPAAIEAAAKVPGLLVGAGTVLTVDQVKQAVDLGSKFIVTPGLNPKVVGFCVDHKIPVTPGVVTPGEIERALDFGLDVVKFFPAEGFGGVKTIRALSAPYGMMKFMPTGGVTAENLADYLKLPAVIACGGSWMATKELINGGRFDEITRITKDAVALANAIRP